jgi:hypothetical protein
MLDGRGVPRDRPKGASEVLQRGFESGWLADTLDSAGMEWVRNIYP